MGRARNVGVWTQRVAVAGLLALIVGFAVRVGSTSSQSLEFRDPLIWLVSTATGEVVQADAGSGDVTARVSVGSENDSLDVAQHGADALVLNRTTGEVSRVNGSLLAVAERSPVQVDAESRLLLRGDAARILTASAVIPVDPSNAEVGEPVAVPTLGSAVLDEQGTVWGLDPDRKVLAVNDDVAEVRVPTETRPFAIADAGGHAQLVDGSGPALRSLEFGTGLGGDSCVGGGLGAGVVVGGSVEAPGRTVVMADPTTGTVRMSDLDSGRCTSVVIDNAAGAEYGPAVESGGFAFVPILSTGEVVVIRVAEGTIVNRYTVTGVERPFDLTAKDGTVWFNEPNGADAGVIGQDGVLERVNKYAVVDVSAAQGGGQPGDEQPDPGANNNGDQGDVTGTEAQPGVGQPGTQPADGSSDAAGSESRSVGSNGGATGPVEDVDLDGLVADFTFSKRVVEVGEEVTFVDRSQGGPVAWTWEFGDGSFTTGPEASHSWDEVGAYRVTLRIESPTGTAAATATIEVVDENTRSRPSADFRYSAARVEVGEAVTFNDRSTGNPTDLVWDFGDGTSAAGPTVEHSWRSAGTYRVALTATNPLGSDTSEPATITVYDRVEKPTAVIDATVTDASVNQTVSFTSRSTGNPTELLWTFDDGTSARGEKVAHAWTEPGSYTVRLHVENSAGESEATTTVVVDERVMAPVARLVASASTVEQGQTVQFTSLSINNPTRLVWEFGDGASDSGSSVSHTYTRAGRFTVTLRASNAAGDDEATTTIVVVADVPAPVAAFSMAPDSPVTAGVPVQFTDQSTGGTPSEWSWSFGDGTPGSSLRNPTHVFTEGTYTVRLEVKNNGGHDDVTRQIVVRPPAPVADFTFAPGTPNAGAPVQFTDASRNVPAGTTWSWNFGDGTPGSSQRSPSHTFAERNSYNVTLTVTSPGGVSNVTKTVAVNPRPPAPNFGFAPTTNITTATDVQFSFRLAAGTGEPESFLWEFGDGQTSTDRNPVHRYGGSGSYRVVLTVENPGGRVSSPPQTIRVTAQPPAASFDVAATPRVAGTPVVFNNTTPEVAGLTYRWDFGDGTTSAERSPSHTFDGARNYDVRLRVTLEGVNSDAPRQTIRIYPQPTATINALPANIVQGRAFTISAAVTGGDATWEFSEGNGPTNGASVSHTFTATGPQRATVIVTNAGGGEVRRTIDITVQPAAPVVTFTMRAGSSPGTIVFTNTSTVGAPYDLIEWDFGDDSDPVRGNEVTHTYDEDDDGPFTVRLTLRNVTDTASATQRIDARPQANFSFSGGPITTEEDVDFENTTPGGPYPNASVTWDFDDGGATATGNEASHRFSSGTHNVRITVVHPMWGAVTRTRPIIVI